MTTVVRICPVCCNCVNVVRAVVTPHLDNARHYCPMSGHHVYARGLTIATREGLHEHARH
jgi:hypothetical protein